MKKSKPLVAAAVSLLLLGSVGVEASASEVVQPSPLEMIQSASRVVDSPASSLLAEVATLGAHDVDPIQVGVTSMPSDSSQSLRIAAKLGQSFKLRLPFSDGAIKGLPLLKSAVSFNNRNGSISIVIPKSDASVQFATIITGPFAPKGYVYELQLPQGLDARLNVSGGVSLTDSKGQWLGAIASPWAVDSRGMRVKTHFDLKDSKLTQFIDHGVAGVTYPVIADPWLGFDQISKTSWTSDGDYSPTLSVFPTLWGRSTALATTFPLNSGALGLLDQLSMSAAWSEALSKTSRVGHPNPDTPTMAGQFACHYFWVSKYDPTKASWNLDSLRPNATLAYLLMKRCNVR